MLKLHVTHFPVEKKEIMTWSIPYKGILRDHEEEWKAAKGDERRRVASRVSKAIKARHKADKSDAPLPSGLSDVIITFLWASMFAMLN